MAEFNIGYEALVSCHKKLISEISQDPKQMAITLFQHRFIFEGTKDKINELDRTRRDMAILLVDDIESRVKSHPEFYKKFLLILGENELLYCDLVKSLQEEYERIEAESKDGNLIILSHHACRLCLYLLLYSIYMYSFIYSLTIRELSIEAATTNSYVILGCHD